VPFLAAIPALFHEPAHSSLPHAREPAAVDVALGASELLPMVAILPFMLYQLAAFGTLHFVVPKWVNWIINTGILCLILAACVAHSGGRVHADGSVDTYFGPQTPAGKEKNWIRTVPGKGWCLCWSIGSATKETR